MIVNFSENLKSLMKEKKITYKAMAEQIGSSESAIHSYIYGKHVPTLYVLCDIADVLQVSLDRLVYGE